MLKDLKNKLWFHVKDLGMISLMICGVFFILTALSFIVYFIIKSFE